MSIGSFSIGFTFSPCNFVYPIHLNNYFSTLLLDMLLASSLLITVLARVQILFKRLLKGSMSFELLIKKMKRLVAYLAKAYPGFPSIDEEYHHYPPSPWMGCQSIARLPSSIHQASLKIRWYPFVLLGGERHCEREVFFPNYNTLTQPGLKPTPLNAESSTLTLRLQLLQQMLISNMLKEMLGNR